MIGTVGSAVETQDSFHYLKQYKCSGLDILNEGPLSSKHQILQWKIICFCV